MTLVALTAKSELVSQVVVKFEALPGKITTTCDTNSLSPVSVTSVTTSAKDITGKTELLSQVVVRFVTLCHKCHNYL